MAVKNLGWREAILEVLYSAPGSLHYTDIAEQIRQRELRYDLGSTPANSVAATITLSLQKDGEKSPFVRVGHGMVALRQKVTGESGPRHFNVGIRLDSRSGEALVLESVSPNVTVVELIRLLLPRLELPVEQQDWSLAYQGSTLPLESQLQFCLPDTEERLELVLFRPSSAVAETTQPRNDLAQEDNNLFESDFDVPSLDESASAAEAQEESSSDFDLALDDSVALEAGGRLEASGEAETAEDDEAVGEEDAEGAVAGPTQSRKAVTLRATVRYYSRMNPERVYPLLVLITRDMVEMVRKKDTDQRSSSPFEVDASTPVEIEPILPGCDCHPPKIVTRLSGGDLTATFRVVPRVMGKVDGASVTIRQDHTLLAEVALNVKVVQRTWVVLSGVITFVLPGLSAILKHFGLDFETQKDQGFNLYLSAARLVFDQISPFALTTGLGVATGLLWWFTRPRIRDVFWEIEKVGPAEKLERIAASMESTPQQASQDLMELLKAFPDYQPARLFCAERHYNKQNYGEALKEYEWSFKLGATESQHYRHASFAASKLRQNERALQILQEAERILPPGEITGVMLYNMGCYHVRLGDTDKAMDYLRRAIAAGYTKAESYQNDPDLTPLRSRPDFQRLLTEDLTVHFKCPKCNKTLWAKAKLARRRTKCPKCSTILSIPATN